MSAQAQPDALPLLKFRLDNVLCFESGGIGLGPSNIVETGASITLRSELGFDGSLAGLVVGDTFSVFFHLQNVETGATTTLAGGTFVVPAATAHITHTSGPFTTGTAGSGADLEIPAGFAAGTFRCLTHVHPVDPAMESIVAAFSDNLIIMVVNS